MSIVVKGHDVGVEKIMPTVTKKINGSGRENIDIDLQDSKSTKRTIIFEHGNVSKKYISFGFNLDGYRPDSNQGSYSSYVQYPQKHVVDIVLTGTNGENGFLLDIPSISGSSAQRDANVKASIYQDAPIKFPTSLSSAVEIRLDGSSDLRNGWKVREYDGWDTEVNYNEDSFRTDIGNINFPLYTRKVSMFDILARMFEITENNLNNADLFDAQASRSDDVNSRIILFHKYLNFLYSESNTVTLRFTFELKAKGDYFLVIEKFQGGITLS